MTIIQDKISLDETLTAISMREKLLKIMDLANDLPKNLNKIQEITPFVNRFSMIVRHYNEKDWPPSKALYEAEMIARGGTTPFHHPYPNAEEIQKFLDETAPTLLDVADIYIETAVKNGIVDHGECYFSIDEVYARLKPFKTKIKNNLPWRWNENSEQEIVCPLL